MTQMNKSLLILKSHVRNLMGMESFLRKRDWHIDSTTNLKEALRFLIKNKPTFMMISADFPHRKIEELSGIIAKLFPVCTISFAESNSVESYQFISAMGTNYQLYPPVTGPAFERIVNKFSKESSYRPAAGRPALSGMNEELLVENIFSQLSDEKPDAQLMQKGIQTALEDSVVRAKSTENVQRLGAATQLACLAVHSARYSGYLVAAMGKNQSVDSLFIQNVREKLFAFLKSGGENVSEAEVMNLAVKEVSFLDLAHEHAAFLKTSLHYSQEVALAFFPYPRLQADFQESYQEDMMAVPVSEIKAETVLDFNLYLYLPANKKALLYTPRGGMLYGKQKEKFVNAGISHMHISKADLSGFNKYRAENFLNDKIEEFKEQAPSKPLTA